MARLFTSGFELGSITAGVEISGPTGTTSSVSTDSGYVRTGTYSNKILVSTSFASSAFRFAAAGAGKGIVYIRAYVKFSSLPAAGNCTLLSITDTGGLTLGAIYMSGTDKKLGILYFVGATATYATTSTNALQIDQWYRLELGVNVSSANTQIVTAKLDGVQFDTKTGSTTAIANAATTSVWGMFFAITDAAGTGTCYYDDIAINDSSGVSQNSYPGDGKVIALRPAGAGESTGWTRAGTDSGANWSQCNNKPPNDVTSYVLASTLNALDMYTVTSSGLNSLHTINVVEVGGRMYKSGTSPTMVFRLIKQAGGTQVLSTAITPSATAWITNTNAAPFTSPIITYADPDGAAWTSTTLGTMQIGIKETVDTTKNIFVSEVWSMVEYIDTPPTVVLNTPTEAFTTTNTTPPNLVFTGTDAQGQQIGYNIQVATDNLFSAGLLSKFSATDTGFAGTTGHPFNTNTQVTYTIQSALAPGTYYWRVAGIDLTGSNTYGAWSPGSGALGYQSFVLTEPPFAVSGTSDQRVGTASIAVNGTIQTGKTSPISGTDGTWTISGVTKPNSGDAITVFISDANETSIFKSTAVTTYSGTGLFGGMVLNKHILSVGSDQNRSLILTDLGKWNYSNNNNVMHSVSGSVLTVYAGGTFTDQKLNILAGNTLTIGTAETLTTYDLTITGTLVGSGAATINVAHNWDNTSGTFTAGSSTVTLNGTTATQTLSGTLNGTSAFYNLTITNNSGTNPSNNEITDFVPSVIFSTGTGAGAKVTNNYTINAAHVRVSYYSGYTYEFANINWVGTSGAGNQIYFRNSVDTGVTAWSLKVTGTQTVSYVNVSRSTAIITGGGIAISAFDGTNNNAGSNPNWVFINTRIRQEINLINGSFPSTTGATVPVRLSSINPNYSGSAAPYFEIVAKNTDSALQTVYLRNQSGDGEIARVDIPGSTATPTRFRSIAFTMPTAFTQVYVSIPATPSAGQVVVNAARVVIIQDLGANPATKTETQIEIGNYELNRTYTTATPLDYPKYWKYTAASWDTGVNFMAEVAYNSSNALGLVTIVLQRDNAGDFNFFATEVVKIVDAQGPTAVTLSPRISFTPVDGCNYRLAAYISSATYNYTIYTAKIIVSQANQDLITVAYDNKSFSITNQDATAHGLAFSYDGTKMYCLGDTNDRIYQYTLNPAWDVSSADYSAAKSLLISGQSTASAGITISSDGKKFYVMANTGSVMQYSIPTAWDISTATYDSITKAIGGEDLTARQVSFKPDGTKMYVGGSTNEKIYQYSLSSAWNVSSATYDNVFISVAGQDISSRGDMISWDGTRMYMSGNTTPSIYQYNLSTPWDLSTATYTRSFSVNSYDNNTYGVQCKPDGTKIYFIGAQNSKVYQYSMSAAPNTTLLEAQYLLQNTNKGTTGLQDFDTYWVPTDWSGTYNKNFYHEINSSADTADAAKLQSDPNGTPTDVTSSSATGTALRSRSSAMTMPSSAATIDTNITNTPIYASRIIAAVSVPCFPTVISPTATDIAIPNATMGANVVSDGGSSLTARGIVWGTSPSPTTNMAAEGGTSTGVYTQFVTTLLTGAMIYYRGYATNSLGTAYSEDGGVIIPGPNEAVQYDSDHVTKIATEGSTTNTSVYLDFSTTALSSSEYVTPKVEVRAIGDAFTGTATHTGEVFNFSPGTPDLRTYATTIYDSANDRIIVYGGKNMHTNVYFQDVWEMKIPTANNPNPIWRQLFPTGTPPGVRNAMLGVYDSLYQRIIFYGGLNVTIDYNDFYYLTIPSDGDGVWNVFTPSGNTSTTRWGIGGVYDPLNQRLVFYGGNHDPSVTNVDLSDLWEVSLPEDLSGINSIARQMAPGNSGASAGMRSEHTAIYDSANTRMVIFAGWSGSSRVNTVKSVTLPDIGDGTWETLAVGGTAPLARSGHSAIYDSVNQRMVTFMGQPNPADNSGKYYNDIRELTISGTSFSWIASRTSDAGTLPGRKFGINAMYDDVHSRAIIFGGNDTMFSSNQVHFVDLSSTSASKLYYYEASPVVNLKPCDGTEAVYDDTNEQWVCVGGYGRIRNVGDPEGTGNHHNETWTYSVNNNALNFVSSPISFLSGELMNIVYDSYNKRVIKFGGLGYNQDLSLNDLWQMSMDLSNADYKIWKPLVATGTAPSPRWGSAVIYDPTNQRMILFGGENITTGAVPYKTDFKDVYRLSLIAGSETWVTVSPGTMSPSVTNGLFQSKAIYDPVVHSDGKVRMLIYGGQDAVADIYYNNVWSLCWNNTSPNVITWQTITVGNTGIAPPATRGHTAVYQGDYSTKRVIVFGGTTNDVATGGNEINTVSMLNVTNLDPVWTATSIDTSNGQPIARRSGNAIYDPVNQRMILQGGRDISNPAQWHNDFWELTLPAAGSWVWKQLNPTNYLKTSVSVPTLTNNTGYHWQAWSTGSVSGDTLKVSYGGNLESVVDFIVGTLSAPLGIKVWDGTGWSLKPVKVWVGGAWVQKPVKVWIGGAWVVKG